MSVQPVRHVFTADEYERMGGAGLFGEDDRVELVEGEIVEMTPIGSRHVAWRSRQPGTRLGQLGTVGSSGPNALHRECRYSARICGSVMPPARASSTMLTRIRVPLTTACP